MLEVWFTKRTVTMTHFVDVNVDSELNYCIVESLNEFKHCEQLRQEHHNNRARARLAQLRNNNNHNNNNGNATSDDDGGDDDSQDETDDKYTNSRRAMAAFNCGNTHEFAESYEQACRFYFNAWHLEPFNNEYSRTFEECVKHAIQLSLHDLKYNKYNQNNKNESSSNSCEFFYHYYAIFLKKLRRYQESMIEYSKLLEISPNNSRYLFSFAGLFYEIDNNDKYKELICQAIKLDSGNAVYYHDFGFYLHHREHNYYKAKDMYLKAIALNPESPLYLRNYAYLLKVLRKFTEAQPYIEQAFELEPNSLDNYLLSASIKSSQTDYLNAKEDFKIAMRLEPDNWKPYSRYGQFLQLISDFDRCELYHLKSLSLSKNPRNLQSYSQYLYDISNFDKCLLILLNDIPKMDFKLGTTHLSDIPSNDQIRKKNASKCHRIGLIYCHLNNFLKSIEYFENGLKLDDKNECLHSNYLFALLKQYRYYHDNNNTPLVTDGINKRNNNSSAILGLEMENSCNENEIENEKKKENDNVQNDELYIYDKIEYVYWKGLYCINRFVPNERQFCLHIKYSYMLAKQCKDIDYLQKMQEKNNKERKKDGNQEKDQKQTKIQEATSHNNKNNENNNKNQSYEWCDWSKFGKSYKIMVHWIKRCYRNYPQFRDQLSLIESFSNGGCKKMKNTRAVQMCGLQNKKKRKVCEQFENEMKTQSYRITIVDPNDNNSNNSMTPTAPSSMQDESRGDRFTFNLDCNYLHTTLHYEDNEVGSGSNNININSNTWGSYQQPRCEIVCNINNNRNSISVGAFELNNNNNNNISDEVETENSVNSEILNNFDSNYEMSHATINIDNPILPKKCKIKNCKRFQKSYKYAKLKNNFNNNKNDKNNNNNDNRNSHTISNIITNEIDHSNFDIVHSNSSSNELIDNNDEIEIDSKENRYWNKNNNLPLSPNPTFMGSFLIQQENFQNSSRYQNQRKIRQQRKKRRMRIRQKQEKMNDKNNKKDNYDNEIEVNENINSNDVNKKNDIEYPLTFSSDTNIESTPYLSLERVDSTDDLGSSISISQAPINTQSSAFENEETDHTAANTLNTVSNVESSDNNDENELTADDSKIDQMDPIENLTKENENENENEDDDDKDDTRVFYYRQKNGSRGTGVVDEREDVIVEHTLRQSSLSHSRSRSSSSNTESLRTHSRRNSTFDFSFNFDDSSEDGDNEDEDYDDDDDPDDDEEDEDNVEIHDNDLNELDAIDNVSVTSAVASALSSGNSEYLSSFYDYTPDDASSIVGDFSNDIDIGTMNNNNINNNGNRNMGDDNGNGISIINDGDYYYDCDDLSDLFPEMHGFIDTGCTLDDFSEFGSNQNENENENEQDEDKDTSEKKDDCITPCGQFPSTHEKMINEIKYYRKELNRLNGEWRHVNRWMLLHPRDRFDVFYCFALFCHWNIIYTISIVDKLNQITEKHDDHVTMYNKCKQIYTQLTNILNPNLDFAIIALNNSGNNDEIHNQNKDKNDTHKNHKHNNNNKLNDNLVCNPLFFNEKKQTQIQEQDNDELHKETNDDEKCEQQQQQRDIQRLHALLDDWVEFTNIPATGDLYTLYTQAVMNSKTNETYACTVSHASNDGVVRTGHYKRNLTLETLRSVYNEDDISFLNDISGNKHELNENDLMESIDNLRNDVNSMLTKSIGDESGIDNKNCTSPRQQQHQQQQQQDRSINEDSNMIDEKSIQDELLTGCIINEHAATATTTPTNGNTISIGNDETLMSSCSVSRASSISPSYASMTSSSKSRSSSLCANITGIQGIQGIHLGKQRNRKKSNSKCKHKNKLKNRSSNGKNENISDCQDMLDIDGVAKSKNIKNADVKLFLDCLFASGGSENSENSENEKKDDKNSNIMDKNIDILILQLKIMDILYCYLFLAKFYYNNSLRVRKYAVDARYNYYQLMSYIQHLIQDGNCKDELSLDIKQNSVCKNKTEINVERMETKRDIFSILYQCGKQALFWNKIRNIEQMTNNQICIKYTNPTNNNSNNNNNNNNRIKLSIGSKSRKNANCSVSLPSRDELNDLINVLDHYQLLMHETTKINCTYLNKLKQCVE